MVILMSESDVFKKAEAEKEKRKVEEAARVVTAINQINELYAELNKIKSDLKKYGTQFEWGHRKSKKVRCIILRKTRGKNKKRVPVCFDGEFYIDDRKVDDGEWVCHKTRLGRSAKEASESIAWDLVHYGKLPGNFYINNDDYISDSEIPGLKLVFTSILVYIALKLLFDHYFG
jgi:hypothetical protein